MTEFLSPSEVQELTGRRVRAGQCTWLTENGVPFKRDGQRVIISREHVRLWVSGVTFAPSSAPRMDLIA